MPSLLVGFLILLVSFILQTTLVPQLRIMGAQPDLILIVVVSYGFIEGPAVGSGAGFIGGLLQDLFAIYSVGLNALSKTIVGYLAGLVEKALFGKNILLPAVAIFFASLLSNTIYVGTAFLLGEQMLSRAAFLSIILPSAIYSGLVSFFVYPLLCRLVAREEKPAVVKRRILTKGR